VADAVIEAEARQMEKETHQANATGPNFDVDEMAGNHEAV